MFHLVIVDEGEARINYRNFVLFFLNLRAEQTFVNQK